MKIADSESIKAGEQELIHTIMEGLDNDQVAALAAENLTIDTLAFRDGDMVVHGGQVVYKMRFETSLSLCVLLDRDGNLIAEEDSEEMEERSMIGAETLEASEDEVLLEFEPPDGLEVDTDTPEIFQKNQSFWSEKVDATKEPESESGEVFNLMANE